MCFINLVFHSDWFKTKYKGRKQNSQVFLGCVNPRLAELGPRILAKRTGRDPGGS